MNNDNQSNIDSIASLFPDELIHLKTINSHLDKALNEANESVMRLDKQYMDTKKYMAEYRGEIDPREMFQEQRLLDQIDMTGVLSVKTMQKLSKQKNSPYFARIDFQEESEHSPSTYYIGPFVFIQDGNILIYDWRAPVSSMFYDYEKGQSSYKAPIGDIKGELKLKRQLKIKNSKLEYVLETSTNIQDDILQKELAQNSDEKMKSIISTIQKEQNLIIRNEEGKTMIIQGVAGSGKTSIALHKIAFLLYKFKDTLTSKSVAILSPNKVFADYISSVLPELGEEPITELSFVDLATDHLNYSIDFETEETPIYPKDEGFWQRVSFKSTLDFVYKLDEFLEYIDQLIFEEADITFQEYLIPANWIAKRFNAYNNYPISYRVNQVIDDVLEEFSTLCYKTNKKPKAKVIEKKITSMLKFKNSLSLYKYFYKWLNRPSLLVLKDDKTLEYSDVYPYLYVSHYFDGLEVDKAIKHLVIDEMQDYTPIQYTVINKIYPCQKTILGDFGQFVKSHHLHTLEDIKTIYKDGIFAELTKSYRCTYEIISLANKVKPNLKLEPIKRHGEAPSFIKCDTTKEQIAKIGQLITTFEKCDDNTLGIILKTQEDAQHFYDLLHKTYQVNLITPTSQNFDSGISITSIQMSKGLEFDHVIIPNLDNKTYFNQYDQSLLYIGITRAMHKLTILYIQNPSPYLPV